MLRAIVIGLSAALLHYLSMPTYDFPEAAYMCVVPLVFWAYRQPSWKQYAYTIFASGFLSWFLILFWLRHVTFAGLVCLSAVLACFWLLWGLFVRWVIPYGFRQSFAVRIFVSFACAGCWVVLEWVRGWLFTGFPWLPLSASQWQRPVMLQVMEWTGSAGLSFILIFFNVCMTYFIVHVIKLNRRKKKRDGKRFGITICPDLYAAFALFALCFLTFSVSLEDKVILSDQPPMFKAALVQPNVPAVTTGSYDEVTTAWRFLREQMDALKEAEDIDFVVWPESALATEPVSGNTKARYFAERITTDIGLPVLGGALVKPDDKWYNGAVFISPESGVSELFYAKRHLVPFGEYVMWGEFLPFLKKVVPLNGEFAVGERNVLLRVFANGKDWKVGNLICFEDVFSELAVDNVKAGADFHLVITNNAWFGEEAGAYQHAAHSVLRAVETRRPVIRCGNGGWSGYIDAYGSIRKILVGPERTIYFQGWDSVTPQQSPYWKDRLTFYVQHGNWFVAVSFGLMVFGALLLLRLKKNASSVKT